MPLGKRVQALPGNELLRDLPLELNAVGTLSGHGFHPLKAQLVKSLTSNCPAPGAHSTTQIAALKAGRVGRDRCCSSCWLSPSQGMPAGDHRAFSSTPYPVAGCLPSL